MITRFDHVTVVVSDVRAAIDFFALLGFEQEASVTIAGDAFERFLDVEAMEATHVVLAVPGLSPRFEVQLMQFHHPLAQADPHAKRLDKLGYNHICFAVSDIKAVVAQLQEQGVHVRGPLDGFHARRLYFVTGPEDITIELSEAL